MKLMARFTVERGKDEAINTHHRFTKFVSVYHQGCQRNSVNISAVYLRGCLRNSIDISARAGEGREE